MLIVASALRAAPDDSTADGVLGQLDFESQVYNQPDGLPTASSLALSNAAHVAIAPSGRVYVSDADNNRVLSWPSASSFTNGQAADFVIGQPDFTSNTPNHGGVSGSSFFLPQGLAIDAGGHLWVTDAFNHRVLKFNDPMSDATPTTADLVVGQPDLNSNLENLGQGGSGPAVALPDSLQYPGRVVVRGGDLWIADSGNSRVLHYAYPMANKPLADRVFGQYGDFTRRAKNNDGAGNNFGNVTADNLYNPIGIALDSAARLYVSDWNNHRVLRYDDPLTSDTTADAVFGQPDFSGSSPDSGGLMVGLQRPIDVAFDATGRLYVVDSGNHRVLAYESPLTQFAPTYVFGQLGLFTSDLENHGLGIFATDADGLFGPTGVALDASGNVVVVDTNNQRVLRYDAPLPQPIAGDVNCDGAANLDDIAPLVLALVDPAGYGAAYPACDLSRADIDGNMQVDGRDAQAFVERIVGP